MQAARIVPALGAVVLAIVSACERPQAGAQQDAPSLVVITTYGVASLADHSAELSPLETQHAGGVLGNILDIAEDRNGTVYVLDAAFQKVAVFRRDGTFDRLILGGAGKGPGEFSRPRSLTIDDNGRIWVYDQVASRLTLFSNAGDVVRTIPLTVSILKLRYHQGRLYGARTAAAGENALVVLDTMGQVVRELLQPGTAELAAGAGRAGFTVGVDAAKSRVIVAHATIGVWTNVLSFSTASVGVPLFPDAAPVFARVSEQSPRHQAHLMHHVWGTGGTKDGRIAVYFAYGSRNPAAARAGVYQLALFTADGTHLQTLPVPADRGTFHMSTSTGDVLVVRENPYPHVVRLRLVHQ